MKNCIPFVVGALLISLFVGCSKRSAHSNWTSSDSMTVEPGGSVGPVHSGMTMQQVAAELGEPDWKKEGQWIYRNLGVEVHLSDGGTVQQVVCSAAGNAGFPKSFGGHTKEGIGIGATHDEVLKAYGNPTSTESQKRGLVILKYDSLGVVFMLLDDKVNLIYIRFKS